MKQHKRLVATALAAAIYFTAGAQHGLVGFANYSDMGMQGTTGGAGGKIVHVTTREDFERYAGADGPFIIILDADLKGHYDYNATPRQKHDVIAVKSNKTIIGGGSGAHLDSLGLDIKNQKNIIIRNLRITKADPDAIAFRNSHHIWVDHCDLSSQKEERDENDGLLDFTYGSSYMTVSWCRFHDHDKTSICSSGTRNFADYGRQRVTYHHNAFINCTQRNPRIGYGLGHIFNDYNEGNTLYAIGMFARARVNVDNCYFKNVKSAFNQMYSSDSGENDAYWGFLKSTGNIFDNTTGNTEGNSCGFDVAQYYDYDFAMDKAADVPKLVAMTGCTAGLESDIIPFPGDGATGATEDTRPFCCDIEEATGYTYKIGLSPDAMKPANPTSLKLHPMTTYYWQATAEGGKYNGKTSSVFRFTTASAKARFPIPYNGNRHTALREPDKDASATRCVKTSLRWSRAFDAHSYTVYIGTDKNMRGATQETVYTESCRPKELKPGKTYYWRVDVNKKDGTVEKGEVWNFKSDISLARTGRNEAEHAVKGGLCFPERATAKGWIAASNDSCCTGDQGPGFISFVWAGEPGTYNITTAYFDEKSGEGSFALYVNDKNKDAWTANDNRNIMRTRTTYKVQLNTGDEIRLEFNTHRNMRCRTDYIDIEPA